MQVAAVSRAQSGLRCLAKHNSRSSSQRPLSVVGLGAYGTASCWPIRDTRAAVVASRDAHRCRSQATQRSSASGRESLISSACLLLPHARGQPSGHIHLLTSASKLLPKFVLSAATSPPCYLCDQLKSGLLVYTEVATGGHTAEAAAPYKGVQRGMSLPVYNVFIVAVK